MNAFVIDDLEPRPVEIKEAIKYCRSKFLQVEFRLSHVLFFFLIGKIFRPNAEDRLL